MLSLLRTETVADDRPDNPLEFVPAVTLTPDPQQIMVPAEGASQSLTLLTRVRYHGTKSAKVSGVTA